MLGLKGNDMVDCVRETGEVGARHDTREVGRQAMRETTVVVVVRNKRDIPPNEDGDDGQVASAEIIRICVRLCGSDHGEARSSCASRYEVLMTSDSNSLHSDCQ